MSSDVPDDPTQPGDDATVMRAEASLSAASISEVSGGAVGFAEMPKVLKQRFVLEDKLGSGGMGTVFRAKDLRKVEARDKQPHVAIKVLNSNFHSHPEAFIALEREASKSQALRHSNIVSIFDFDKDRHVPFITMELLEGQELGDLLKSYPSGLPDSMAWSVTRSMIAGLAHAHSENVVHADFKPGNIFVSPDNVAKILDFGIARAMRVNQAGDRVAEKDTEFDPSRFAALTPVYASREMLNGDTPEPRDDLFSLGVVVYMIFSGRHPYGRLNANDAALEKLQPERLKRLTRRQWKVLEQCLAFNRQDRPSSALEVLEELTGKPGWHSWGLAAGLAAVTIAVLASSISGSQQLDQVKDEVRQSTLVDSQVARITQLLEKPAYDENWNRLLFSELQTLKTLAPNSELHTALRRGAREVYTRRLMTSNAEDDEFSLYAAGIRYGNMGKARMHLMARLGQKADSMLSASVSIAWLGELDTWMDRFESNFSDSVDLGLKRLQLIDYLGRRIRELSSDSVLLAESAYDVYAAHAFDLDLMDTVEDEVSSAVAQQTEDEKMRRVAQLTAQAVAEIDQTLDVSCLRVDITRVAAQMKTFDSGQQASVRDRILPRLSACIKRLSVIDPDRAVALQHDAVDQLGPWAAIVQEQADPCGMRYLVGNGQQSGRSGYCNDEIDHRSGPRLVVVPADDGIGRFAISKYEVSLREFSLYCLDTQRCDIAAESDLPITNLSIQEVLDYTQWLSLKTGRQYRLPNIQEWTQVAQGAPDPNRNCRVDAGGVTRGHRVVPANAGSANALGVYHILGNVQELVAVQPPQRNAETGAGYVAVGGAYADPIEVCMAATQRPIAIDGDDQTGFRVVREVS